MNKTKKAPYIVMARSKSATLNDIEERPLSVRKSRAERMRRRLEAQGWVVLSRRPSAK